ncbi:MAG: hypothetical protein IJE07_13120 [Clostridia bacterium]|nr:hypothetical protein [Clostridia bacterium]
MEDEIRLKLEEAYLAVLGAVTLAGDTRNGVCKALLQQGNQRAYETFDVLVTALYMAHDRLEETLFAGQKGNTVL